MLDSTSDAIEIRVGVSFFTWGEAITLDIEPATRVGSIISRECRHRLPTTMDDFGQSARDLGTVLRGLHTEPIAGPEQATTLR